MSMMQVVANDAVLISEISNGSEYVHVIGGTERKREDMLRAEAELYKENQLRSNFGLEVHGEMPPKQAWVRSVCRRCRQLAIFRCSACRMAYCSKFCQRQSWRRQVFICAVRRRPNDFDRLSMYIARRACMSHDGPKRSQLLHDLFSDDHICRTFGFVNCADYLEVSNLLCIYGMMESSSTRAIQSFIDGGNLGVLTETQARLYQHANRDVPERCNCVDWLLRHRDTGFPIPNWDGEYLYMGIGLRIAEQMFSIQRSADD